MRLMQMIALALGGVAQMIASGKNLLHDTARFVGKARRAHLRSDTDGYGRANRRNDTLRCHPVSRRMKSC
jgi:hypothetical protein